MKSETSNIILLFSFLISCHYQFNAYVEQLLNHIKNYYPLSEEAQFALHDCFEQVVFSKNEYLL
ncbi:MAG TPA: hypothetical protein VIZ28_14670, partial [Chitinophagaceae bacterium]